MNIVEQYNTPYSSSKYYFLLFLTCVTGVKIARPG